MVKKYKIVYGKEIIKALKNFYVALGETNFNGATELQQYKLEQMYHWAQELYGELQEDIK